MGKGGNSVNALRCHVLKLSQCLYTLYIQINQSTSLSLFPWLMLWRPADHMSKHVSLHLVCVSLATVWLSYELLGEQRRNRLLISQSTESPLWGCKQDIGSRPRRAVGHFSMQGHKQTYGNSQRLTLHWLADVTLIKTGVCLSCCSRK